MITIVYSTHKNKEYNDKFKTHLINSVGLNDVQILEYQNNNQYSLAQVYNSGITESIYDIVVCCHNDIKLEKNWGIKLLNDFTNNPEFGIIGKAGSCYFPESGVYWERMQQTMVGQVWHHPDGQNKWINNYSPKLPFIIPVVTIDGLFISFDKTKIKHKFDETIGKFHFYDHGFTIPNYLDGVKIGVTSSFEITHQSVGQPNQEFWDSKEKFLNKYKSILPLDLKPEKVYVPEIKTKGIKIKGKIAIIIPTKNNLNQLRECVNSFYLYCDKELFDIFVVDTGSSEENLTEIKNEFVNYNNLKFIEYNFYNYAIINNDVVKNHLTKNHLYILFCNDDVKILNDVLTGFLDVIKNKNKVGTVGARLHYKDNTIQHDGLQVYIDMKSMNVISNHLNKFNYYNYGNNIKEKIGNTAALMMINKENFIKEGMFPIGYEHCFEDVHFNLHLVSKGYINYTNSNCVAYHYESQTRKVDLERNKMMEDYNKLFFPFFKQIFEKIKNKIQYSN